MEIDMSTNMDFMDQILDRFGHEGDKVFYELYCQNNMSAFSKIDVEEFEDIYYSLFDDEISNFIKINDTVEGFDIDTFEEYVDIMLKELIGSAMEEYSYVRFLAEVPKAQWNDIVTQNLQTVQKRTKTQRIYDFYNDKVLQHL